jgi:low temperature requirement protein LtrA
MAARHPSRSAPHNAERPKRSRCPAQPLSFAVEGKPVHGPGGGRNSDGYVDAVSDERLAGRFRRWLWRPPRPHGEPIAGRTVSPLELFYDLVYVAVVSQAAHHLADHVSLRGVGEFAVIFTMIWIGWTNGTLYLELHGREDGRTRTVVFVQMGVLVLLAVFTAEAATSSGRGFALAYATFQALLTWLWYVVHREDRRDHPEFLTPTRRYVTGIGLSAAVVFASAFLPDGPRLAVWACVALGWIGGMLALGHPAQGLSRGLQPTDSLVERFGLFTIIVLGEVVFGVVDGLSAAERDIKTITTGMVALGIGFGFWWIYFDLVSRRLPRPEGVALAGWMLSHLPITMSITAAGAAMASLIVHAHDARTPANTAWLQSSAAAVGLLALTFTIRALADAERLAVVYRPVTLAIAVGAGASVVAGWVRPAPWLFALVLVAILSLLWLFAVSRFLRAGAWGDEPSHPR